MTLNLDRYLDDLTRWRTGVFEPFNFLLLELFDLSHRMRYIKKILWIKCWFWYNRGIAARLGTISTFLLNKVYRKIKFCDSRSRFSATIFAALASFSATRRNSDSWLKSDSSFKIRIFISSISDSNRRRKSDASSSLRNKFEVF